MTTNDRVPTLCVACTRRIGDDPEACTSFPQGIPENIVIYGDDHRRSLAGEEPFELDGERADQFNNWAIHLAPEGVRP